ncbi:FecR domain-containing protein [Geobacter pelophilus]|uniref:FecR domain-containing protein n=1 Tax=Geoanaerobacter pelophilus TaxID=60036 RepID=A0AAW4L2M2_9BACT|nr:FecR family protein [Geoanaerobacter pelophilus]MBT0664457.1 FecR domain-containing protein [Geoanaerobacter pelophilus]
MKSDLGRSLNLISSLIIAISLILNCAVLHAAESIGRFSIIEGSVDLMRGGALPAVPVKTGDQVQTGDFIRTKSNARAEVTFNDGNILKIAQRSRVDVAEYRSAGSGDSRKFNLPRGKVQAVVTKGGTGENKGSRFEIRTPNAVAGVRGTDFFVFHDRNVTGVLVKEGSVYAFNPKMPQNVVTVPAGTITTVSEKGAPQPPRPATEAEKRGAEKETAVKPKNEQKEGKASGNGDTPKSAPGPATASDGPILTLPFPEPPLPPDLPKPPEQPKPPFTDLDNVAPVLSLAKPPYAALTSVATPFNVNSNENARIEYRVDSGIWQGFTGTVKLPTEGMHLVEFQAIDSAGNISSPVGSSIFVGSRDIAMNGTLSFASVSTPLTGRLVEFGNKSGGAWQFSAVGTGSPTTKLKAGGMSNLGGTTFDGFWQIGASSLTASAGAISGGFTYTYMGIDRLVNISTGNVSGSYNTAGWNIAATGNAISAYSTPLGYVADIKTSPMHRLNTIDPNSNLLTIVSQGNMGALLGSPSGLWSTASAPFSILGTYQGPGTQNNYWQGKIGSHNYATGGVDSADGASFIGFIGGSNLDTAGTTSGNLAAIYVAPRGGGQFGAGIIYGAFNGALGSGIWDASGTMNRLELNSAVPSSLSATLATDPTWWASNTVFVNPPPVTGPTIGNQKNFNNAEGFLLDSSMNISSRHSDRGDVLNFTLFKPDPTFGVWQRESFGRYIGSNSDLVLVTDASVTQNVGGKMVPDHLFNVVSLGGWGANGAITGKAYGAWGDWEAGSARLLSGVVNGSYDAGLGTFGAVTNGAWLDVYRFLGLTVAERQQAGFPGIQGSSFSLSGSNALGSSVSLTNIRTFAHAAGDHLSLWATDSVSGSFSGAVMPEGVQIAVNDGGSQIRGSFRLERSGASATTGNQLWLAEINGLGETTGPFRASFNGIAAGTWSGTSFSGTAAGITHPITYYSSFGSTNLLRRYNGGAVYQYDGALHGVFGGMSLWGATPAVPSEFEIAGVHTPAAFANQDYVFSTNIDSFDVPSGSSKTADGGAYKGYLAGALARGTMYPEEPVDGRIAALYAAPDGSAGVLAGKFNGYLDFNGVWESHGSWYPVALGTASPASWSLQTANLPLNVAQNGNFLGAGGGAISTVASIAANSFDRSWISGSPEWGVWNLNTSGTYSGLTYNQWFYKLSANDGSSSFFVNAEINGNRWEALAPPPPSTVSTIGKLKGDVAGNWIDMSPAVPQTGLLIGETVGTFDPVASRWQAVAVGAFMETNTFLQMAATTAGQAKLQQLNIPAFEIGSTDFSGSGAVSGGTINVTLAGVKFFAPTAGGRPSIWATGSVSGSFTGTPTTGNTVALSGSSATVSGLAPTLTIDSWSGNKWRASIMDNAGIGSVGAHSNVNMFGKGAGSYSSSGLSGTAVGTAK